MRAKNNIENEEGRKNMIITYKGLKADIGKDVLIATGSQIIGDVKIAKGASIWYNAVLRADLDTIYIGENSNIQDNSILHVDINQPLFIANNVTVGHGAILHGCTISNNCLIGMGAKILNGAKIGENSLIGAGALITENTEIPPGTLVLGVPGKVIRKLSLEEIEDIEQSALNYYKLAQKHI